MPTEKLPGASGHPKVTVWTPPPTNRPGITVVIEGPQGVGKTQLISIITTILEHSPNEQVVAFRKTLDGRSIQFVEQTTPRTTA